MPVNLGDLSDLGEGDMRCFPDAGDDGVIVCRVDGVLRAIANRCSHARTPLETGRLRGGFISCPLHGARFDVRDGSHHSPPATRGLDVFELNAIDETAVEVVMRR